LATSSWGEKTAFVFDTSTGEQVAALKHDKGVKAIAFSHSGRFIATGCGDSKIYLWEAPASEDPKTTVSLVVTSTHIGLLPQPTNSSPSRPHGHFRHCSMYAHKYPYLSFQIH
jgi:WD40 repeat protein